MLESLDLRRAWDLVKYDLKHRNFIRTRPEVALAESDLDGWLERLGEDLVAGTYVPKSAIVVEVPKGSALVRPGSHLDLADQVVFAACIIALLPKLRDALAGSEDIDNSYRLADGEDEFFKEPFRGWKGFQTATAEILGADLAVSHVVVADVAACYENVDHRTLISDLNGIGIPEEIRKLLTTLLSTWALIHKGIPQGHSAADILGKLYLYRVDDQLRALGKRHIRYVDDIRIFCRSETEAKITLVELAKLLRSRGLNLQSAKSKIVTREDAPLVLDGTVSRIEKVRDELVGFLRDIGFEGDDYVTREEIDALLTQDVKVNVDVLSTAFDELVSTASTYDKSLFRFLVKRLGIAGSSHAVENCFGFLESHPEETDAILKYFSRLGDPEQFVARLCEFLVDNDRCVYPYQRYEILDWLLRCEETEVVSDEVLGRLREWALPGDSRYPYLRRAARIALGVFGGEADLELLFDLYPQAEGDAQQLEIMTSLFRLERQRRNGFLSRAADDNDWNRLAAPIIRRVEPSSTTRPPI